MNAAALACWSSISRQTGPSGRGERVAHRQHGPTGAGSQGTGVAGCLAGAEPGQARGHSARVAAAAGRRPCAAEVQLRRPGEPTVAAALAGTGVSHWLVCGIEAHICVYQSVLGLLASGARVSLVVDATSSRTAANRDLAISQLAARGAALTSVEMCLFDLMGDCRHPAFRQILALVK